MLYRSHHFRLTFWASLHRVRNLWMGRVGSNHRPTRPKLVVTTSCTTSHQFLVVFQRHRLGRRRVANSVPQMVSYNHEENVRFGIDVRCIQRIIFVETTRLRFDCLNIVFPVFEQRDGRHHKSSEEINDRMVERHIYIISRSPLFNLFSPFGSCRFFMYNHPSNSLSRLNWWRMWDSNPPDDRGASSVSTTSRPIPRIGHSARSHVETELQFSLVRDRRYLGVVGGSRTHSA